MFCCVVNLVHVFEGLGIRFVLGLEGWLIAVSI